MNQSESSKFEGTDAVVDPSVIDPNFLLKDVGRREDYRRQVSDKIAETNSQIKHITDSISEMTFVGKLRELILKENEKELQRLYVILNSLKEAQSRLKETIH